MVKVCSSCGIEKSSDSFHKRSDTGRLRSSCKDCTNRKTLFRYHNIPGVKEQHRAASRRNSIKQYGLSFEDVKALLESQSGMCAICSKELVISSDMTNLSSVACVDHCHDSGKVRGILCRSCNSGIGYLKDDLDVLKSAVSYLEKSYG